MPDRFHRLFSSPIFDNEEKTRLAQTLNSFGWSAIAIVFSLILARILTGGWLSRSSMLTLPLVILIIVIVQVMLRRGYVREAGLFLVASTWLDMTYQAWNSDGLRDVAAIAYLVIILLAALLLGWREGLFFGLLGITMLWYFAFEEQQGIRIFQMDDPYSYARDLTAVFVLSGFLIYLLIHSLNRSLHDARLELKERLRSEEKLQRQADYLTALNETALGLLNRSDLRPLLESILTRACDLVNTEHGLIELVLPDDSALRQEVGQGVFAKYNGTLTQRNHGVTGTVWASGQSLAVTDYTTWEKRIALFSDANFFAVMGVPLEVGNTVIGVLAIAHVNKGKPFTQEQIHLMERFAALASLAIDNARLYGQAQKEINERKSAEQALRSSEELFRKVFNNSYVAIVIVTLEEGRFLEANEAFRELSGLPLEQLLGRTSVELDLWEDAQARGKFKQDLLEKGYLQNVPVEFKRKDQPNKTSIAYYELINIKDQRCILCMFYDISEKRQSERALKESEERFRKVFHASPVAICITTMDEGRLQDANAAYWNMTGYNPKTSIGRAAEELEMWDSSEERWRFVNELKQKHSILNPNYEFVEYNTHKPRHAIAFYELIEIDALPCVLSMFYDITEQRQAQDDLQNAEARKRAILQSIPDMIFEVARNGTFLDFMASAEIAPLMPPAEFIGRNIKELFPPMIAEQAMFAIERTLATEQIHAFEYGLPPGEEVQFFEARVTAVTSESTIIMVRDISQRKWVETEREKLINELEEKNSELERFTYTVSHDLKSPLITIKGFLGFLEQDAASGNIVRLKADTQRIADATDKMQTLLNELLELSRVGRLTNPYQLVPFSELVLEALEIVHGRLQEKNIQVNVDENLPTVYGDRQRLIEVMQNLIDNAAKFMGNVPAPRIEIGFDGYENKYPIFFVRDNGVGVDPIHHDRIFGLFNKLDAASEGTGIGLTLVKRIVEVHGGRIWVKSEAGSGSTFLFTLPAGPES
ncbi:MAG: PAS domain S-box protein [Chloroflexi bacterium]|nr:PAS domain S-box protein [Chloroflexota bacterium]